jgi:hypothetical protein
MKAVRLATFCLAACCAAGITFAGPPLVVHEWGTFTSFQDEQGHTISGINVDDEPLPLFVHRLGRVPIFGAGSLPATWSQGAPRCHPGVTLRLETPVLYFHPPAGWVSEPFDVRASFIGGWLTEFFPSAQADQAHFPYDLDAQTRGSLQWKQVRLGDSASARMPETADHVWLAPRNVSAATVSIAETGEAEKYVFYRGVGHLDAPLVVRQRQRAIDVALRAGPAALTTLPRIWLVEVLPDGRVRYRASDPGGTAIRMTTLSESGADGVGGLVQLRREFAAALLAEGLYADEAAALLSTWQLSYFKSEGLRAFFILPQAWTEAHLPLSISTPAAITRVLVGRIELLSEHQRAMLAELQALSPDDFPAKPLYMLEPEILKAGLLTHGPLSQLYRDHGRAIPKSLEVYESLGRFRDALLAHLAVHEMDATRRSRLTRTIYAFSACVPQLRESVIAQP